MTRTITVEHKGTTYYAKVARIKSTTLGTEDHGILTAYLNCEGDGWGNLPSPSWTGCGRTPGVRGREAVSA